MKLVHERQKMVKQLQILGQQRNKYSKVISGIQKWQEKIVKPYGADMLRIFIGGKSQHSMKQTRQEVKDLLIQGEGEVKKQ